jgi:hypothetical protein
MVATVPKEVYTMKNRYVIIKHNAKVYQKATKKQKSQMLDELSELLQMNRHYIGYLLRNTGRVVFRKGKVVVVTDSTKDNIHQRGRKRIYGKDVLRAVKKLWRISGFVSSKHLVGFIRLNKEVLFNHPEIKSFVTDRTKELLLSISASTVDRLLKPYRDRIKLKNRYKGNPFSSNLKKSIKVESWFDKPKEPGYIEVELVHHNRASGAEEFIYTLTATEIQTGWTELEPIKNKAMVWTKAALESICKRIPIPVKRLHSDNGSEFINAHVQKFCKDREIWFTHSRPYRKNDAPYVESKNWSMVRAYTGWRRYETEEELKILRKLLRLVSLRNNLFMPQMKVVERQRLGRKVWKKYEMDIPLNRVLRLKEVNAKTKAALIKLRNTIDIVELSEQIEYLTEELSAAYEKKLRRKKTHG